MIKVGLYKVDEKYISFLKAPKLELLENLNHLSELDILVVGEDDINPKYTVLKALEEVRREITIFSPLLSSKDIQDIIYKKNKYKKVVLGPSKGFINTYEDIYLFNREIKNLEKGGNSVIFLDSFLIDKALNKIKGISILADLGKLFIKGATLLETYKFLEKEENTSKIFIIGSSKSSEEINLYNYIKERGKKKETYFYMEKDFNHNKPTFEIAVLKNLTNLESKKKLYEDIGFIFFSL